MMVDTSRVSSFGHCPEWLEGPYGPSYGVRPVVTLTNEASFSYDETTTTLTISEKN